LERRRIVFDLLVINGKIVDGSGQPAFSGDIGVTGDRISVIGDFSKSEARDTTSKNPMFILRVSYMLLSTAKLP
jgi:N-acyl-D-amino-acid deacylase